MKQRRSKLLSLLLTGAMLVSSLPMTGFAEEAAVLSDEIALEDMAEGSGIAEELPDIPEEITFETESTPETEGRTDTETVPAEDVFVDEDGLIEDESPEETLEPETEVETPEEEAETEGEEDLLISDEEPETETLTEEETEELTESETDILEEENLGADLASGSWTYTVSGSSATITGYTGTLTNLSLPSTLGGKTVTAIKDGAFAGNKKLISVMIPGTVTNIGSVYNYKGAFEGCVNLQSVTINAGSGAAYIGCNTFENCSSLKSIVIPGNYTEIKSQAFYKCTLLQTMEYKASSSSYANQKIETEAFSGCTSLMKAVIPKTVASIGARAFSNCSNLTSLTLNEGLQTISDEAFSGCIKLPSVIIPSTVTALGSVYNYKGVFEGCTKLATVTIKAGTEDAYIGCNTFENCSSLKSVVIPGNYTEIKSQAFYKCTSLQTMEYKASSSSYANQKIETEAFSGCTSLVKAVIPKTVASIGARGFSNCSNLTSLTLNEGLQTISDEAFSGCIKLPSVIIPSTVTALGSVYNYKGVFEGCTKLATVTIKAGTEDAYIGCNTFENCSSLKSVVIPGNYTEIKSQAFYKCTSLQTMEYKASSSIYANQKIETEAFSGCTSLVKAVIPKTVASIGARGFSNCSNLTSLTLNEGLQTISDEAFSGCIKLPSVVIPSTVTALGSVYNYKGVFEGCTMLATVTIKAGTEDAYIGCNTFENCSSLKSVVIPGNYTEIKSQAFYKCISLQTMEYKASSSIYANQKIETEAFSGCTSLVKAVIPKTVASIGARGFSNCSNLTSLTLNEGLQTISDEAFAFCGKLSSVTIPSTVTKIGSVYNYRGAFEGCTGLTKVTIKKNTNADECTLGQNTFKGCTSLSYVYIPSTYTTFCSSNIFANRGILLSIWGEWGSAAETFANENDIPFNRQGLQIGVPKNITAVNQANSIKITWNAAENASQYVVLRKTNGSAYKEIAKVSSTSYLDSSVSAGVTYEYSVKGVYGSLSGSYLTNGAKIVRLSIPVVRTVVNAASGMQITWKQVPYAKSYEVYRRSSGSYTKIATVAAGKGGYFDTAVRNNSGTLYRYAVRAVSGSSMSAYQEGSAVRLTLPKISASNVAKGIKLSWSKVTGASGYAVYRKTSSTAYKKIATISSGSTLTYTDTSVKSKNGNAYIYTVRAVKGASQSVGSDKKIVRLTAPSITKLTNSSSRKLTCKWSKNSKATRYHIQYATNSSFSGAKTIYVGKVLSRTISGLKKGKRYYVRVRAVKDVGSATYFSPWSSYASVKISK